MQKKAQVESLKMVAGLLITAIIVLLLATFIFKLAGIMGSESEDAALGNFVKFSQDVKVLLDNNQSKDNINLVLNVPNDFIIVGFDTDWHGANNPSEASQCHGEGIEKPSICGKNACLCLYRDTNFDDFMADDSPDEVIQCLPLTKEKKNIVISGPADNYYNVPDNCEGEEHTEDYGKDCPNDGAKKYPDLPPLLYGNDFKYEFLVIYGECGDSWLTKNVYIDKIELGNTIYLFLGVKEYAELRKVK